MARVREHRAAERAGDGKIQFRSEQRVKFTAERIASPKPVRVMRRDSRGVRSDRIRALAFPHKIPLHPLCAMAYSAALFRPAIEVEQVWNFAGQVCAYHRDFDNQTISDSTARLGVDRPDLDQDE